MPEVNFDEIRRDMLRQQEEESKDDAAEIVEFLRQKYPEQESGFTSTQYEEADKHVESEKNKDIEVLKSFSRLFDFISKDKNLLLTGNVQGFILHLPHLFGEGGWDNTLKEASVLACVEAARRTSDAIIEDLSSGCFDLSSASSNLGHVELRSFNMALNYDPEATHVKILGKFFVALRGARGDSQAIYDATKLGFERKANELEKQQEDDENKKFNRWLATMTNWTKKDNETVMVAAQVFLQEIKDDPIMHMDQEAVAAICKRIKDGIKQKLQELEAEK